MTAWLSIIGVSDDGLQGLKPAAQQALEQASLIIGGDRHLAMLPDDGRERKSWPSPLLQLVEEILARRGEPTCWRSHAFWNRRDLCQTSVPGRNGCLSSAVRL
jgi:precorrin-6Y C5,15-methyltransferase (decarboxylating)